FTLNLQLSGVSPASRTSRATSKGFFIFNKPSKAARTTLCGLVDPRTFVRTSRTPAACIPARTAPPAITPVPCEAGFISTRPDPKRPINSCGNVFSISGTRIRFFFAASTPFLIAKGTSRALPVPKPTCPASSPTTTRAANERFLPPFTTLVTRLIEISWSFKISPLGEILCLPLVIASFFYRLFRRLILIQTGRTGSVEQRLDASVVNVTTAVINYAGNTGVLRALSDQLANFCRSVDVAARLGSDGFFRCRSRSERLAAVVIDHLRVDVVQAAIDRKPRPLSRSTDLL